MGTPHYLRFARSLAFVSVATAVSACAAEVNTGDGAVGDAAQTDTPVTVDAPHVCANPVCPAILPANGTECGTPSNCTYTSSSRPMTCECQRVGASQCGVFACVGPLGPSNPPELPC